MRRGASSSSRQPRSESQKRPGFQGARARARASAPMNTMLGDSSSATRKSSRTSLGPSPRYFWMSSLPTTRRKLALVLLATAFASSVLPVPGSPYRMTPYFDGVVLFGWVVLRLCVCLFVWGCCVGVLCVCVGCCVGCWLLRFVRGLGGGLFLGVRGLRHTALGIAHHVTHDSTQHKHAAQHAARHAAHSAAQPPLAA